MESHYWFSGHKLWAFLANPLFFAVKGAIDIALVGNAQLTACAGAVGMGWVRVETCVE
jgi:hypothetical protein